MKRFYAYLLIICIMLCFAACTPSSVEESQNSEETSIEETSTPKPFVLSEKVELIDGMMVSDIDRSLKALNLFKGLRYTSNRPTADNYPDPSCVKLTDGQDMDVVYGQNFHAGWTGGSPLTLKFDLGEAQHNLADIAIGCFRIKPYGVELPKYIKVFASNDGKDYVEIAEIDAPIDTPETTKYTFYFSFPKAVTARYILLYLGASDGSYMVLDEIVGYEYADYGIIDNSIGKDLELNLTIEDFYDYNLNLGESNVKVSENDADYNDIRNLATIEGVDFQIEHFDDFFKGHTNSGRDELYKLTDGALHGSDIENDYFRFYRGAGRHVVADLGKLMAVNGCTLAFQDKVSWGIATPPVYYISLSENGTDWVTVFAEHNPEYGKTSRNNDTRNIDFGKEYKARYVRLTFPTVPDTDISCQVYLGEWEIIGRKNPDNAVTATENKDIVYGRYPDPEEYGIKNILWTGIADSVGVHCTDSHVITEETAYNYMVTTDENGKAKEILFDSFAFTSRGDLSWHPDRNEGYSWYLQELFYEGLNLDAVEAARGRVNEELGITEKATVWVSVNCPIIGDTFNGKKIETLEDYIECLKWMADEVIERFNAKRYKNIELAGFYWQVENLRPNKWFEGEAYDAEAATEFNKYVHDRGYMTIWLPYYSYLNGMWHNKHYGFDITCWQPGYVFSYTEPTRLRTIAELAKIYGVGIEIEVEPNAQSLESLELYRAYLKAGVEFGFIDSINAYYQGPVPGMYVLYKDSDNPINKAIYDESILYIQGKLDKDYYKLEVDDISKFNDAEITVRHNKSANINIGEVGDIEYRFSKTPIYGSVRLDCNGTLTYRAMKGYKGEDEICITFYDGESETKTITIKVTVTE